MRRLGFARGLLERGRKIPVRGCAARRARARRWAVVFSIACLSCAATVDAATAAKKNVLVLNSYHRGFIWSDNIMKAITTEFDKSGMDVELYFEYMDTKRHNPEKVFHALEQLYRKKYEGKKFDAIMVSDNNAFMFLLGRRAKLFPDVPVVFCGVNNFDDAMLEGQVEITGVLEEYDLKGTIELALRLHPGAKHVAVISDSTRTGKLHMQRFNEIAPAFEGRVRFIKLVDWTGAELREALRRLPPDTVLIRLSLHLDRNGATFSAGESMELVAASCNLPSYSMWDFKINYGVLGGVVTSGSLQGAKAAQMALRILRGESPDSIPILHKSPNVPMFNYQQMVRFGISRADLPPGSVIVGEPESFYHRYKGRIWAAIGFVVFQVLVIIALAINIARRRRVESELAKHRDHLEELVEERTAELERAQQELLRKERLATLGQLMATVSHEIRNPLGTIHSSIFSIGQRTRGKNLGIEGALERAELSIRRCDQIIEDLLDYTRAPQLKMKRIAVDRWLEELLDEQSIPEGIELVRRFESGLEAEIDWERFRRCVINVINNSCRAMTVNGVATGRLSVETRGTDDRLEIRIGDTGCGIPPENIRRIFEPLFSTKPFGVGLGLSIVKRVMEQHGGDVEIESEKDKGTVVTLWFPLSRKREH